MYRGTRTIGVAALIVGTVLMASPVCAQTSRQPRPYRSLFGSTAPGPPSLHTLDLTISLNGAGDNGLAPAASGEGSPHATFQQLYSANASLAYALHGQRLTADAAGSANLPHYPGSGRRLDALGYSANASLSYALGATSTRTYGSYSYSPYYTMALDPAAAPGASAHPFDFAQARNPNTLTSAGASLSRHIGRRTSAALAYVFSESSFANQRLSLRSQDARISANRQISRRFTLRGSYGYREARFGAAEGPATDRSHDVDIGVGYTRSSLRGRSTAIDLSLGSSAIRREAPALHAGWRGSARVSRTFSPSWIGSAGYSRTLQFHSVLQQPVWANMANADVSGRFGQRVSVSLAATYSNAQRASRTSRGFDIYSASSRMQIGLASFAAIEMQYVYYRYDFPAGYELPAGVPMRTDRQRLQLGASFWLPILRAGSAREARVTTNQ